MWANKTKTIFKTSVSERCFVVFEWTGPLSLLENWRCRTQKKQKRAKVRFKTQLLVILAYETEADSKTTKTEVWVVSDKCVFMAGTSLMKESWRSRDPAEVRSCIFPLIYTTHTLHPLSDGKMKKDKRNALGNSLVLYSRKLLPSWHVRFRSWKNIYHQASTAYSLIG